jgi:hypothetical protein
MKTLLRTFITTIRLCALFIIAGVLIIPSPVAAQKQKTIPIPIKKIIDIPSVVSSKGGPLVARITGEREVLVQKQNEVTDKLDAINRLQNEDDRVSQLQELQRQAFTLREMVIRFNASVIAVEAEAQGIEMSERAASLVKRFDEATAALELKKGVRDNKTVCSDYFREIFKALVRSGLPEPKAQWENKNADTIYHELAGVLSKPGGEWLAVDENEVQRFANSGFVVFGASPKPNPLDPDSHGHLAAVFPVTPTVEKNLKDGSGPFLRDGNETEGTNIAPDDSRRGQRQQYPHDWGAVRRSKIWSKGPPPEYFLWLPSVK